MWTSPQPMTAPFASGPGTRTPGDQYGWSMQAHRAGRGRGDELVEQRLGVHAELAGARATSAPPNSRLNHSIIQ